MSLFERSLAPKINLEPEKFSRNGIDVSKWQGDIDWKAVKDDGIDFAMIRLGLGSKNGSGFRLDPYFEKNVSGALDAGINIGCYFYSYALTIEEAREEAQYVVDVLSIHNGFTYPIVLDMESAQQQELGKDLLTEIVIEFGKVIRGAGYYFMLYSNPSWLKYKLNDEMLGDIDHWLAEWKDEPTYKGDYGIWQHSSKGRVNGIDGDVDLNIAYRDYPTIIQAAGLNQLSRCKDRFALIDRFDLYNNVKKIYCAKCKRKSCKYCYVGGFKTLIGSAK